MRLTLTEVKQRVSKLVPEDIDYEVEVEAGSIAIITKQPEAFGGAGHSLTVKIAKIHYKQDHNLSLNNI